MDKGFFDIFRWGAWLFMGIGVVALIAGAVWSGTRLLVLLKGTRVDGEVVDVLFSKSGNSSNVGSYHPVVEFSTPDGAKHRFSGPTGSRIPDERTGSKVTVYYDPTDPDRAFIFNFKQGLAGPGAALLFGLVFLVLGAAAFKAVQFASTFGADLDPASGRNRIEHTAQTSGSRAEVEQALSSSGLSKDEIEKLKRVADPR